MPGRQDAYPAAREASAPRRCARRQRRRTFAVLLLALWSLQVFHSPTGRQGCFAVAEDKPAPSNSAAPEVKGEKSPPAKAAPENPFPGRPKAPEGILDGGVGWLNAAGPIQLKDLRGKIVLFDFWTYCCINCMHVLPDLKYLEKKYPNELVVIGVHSAKFDNEKDSENIRRAIQRYEIEHPVVNDANMIIWRKFGTRAWPTLAVIDPEGGYLGSISGEGHRELMDDLIQKLIAYHKAKGTLDTTPVHFRLEREKLAPTPLRFPGKVRADEAGNRLFITDSNHNRIVITTLDGMLLDVVGTGEAGARDGAYSEATFDHPQGTVLVGDVLYVADTENHRIRTIDLKAKTVGTLAGTGEQSRFGAKGGPLASTALSSPWALEVVDGTLYIAMAGPHQIWSHRLGSDVIGVFAGSGREDITNGTHSEAALAQPSGLATDGEALFVVDSEGSAVRKITLSPSGSVTTVVGTSDLQGGRSLFEFGDVDGVGGEARLQHPLGVACQNGTLYIADTYNHKIKKVDLKTRAAATWLGNGQRGTDVDPPRFAEPGGVSLAAGRLYIADTNNHVVKVAELQSGAVSVLSIVGLSPPAPPSADESEPAPLTGEHQEVEPQTVAAGETLQIEVAFALPEGYKLNALAPLQVRLAGDGAKDLLAPEDLKKRHRAKIDGDKAVVSIPLARRTGKGPVEVALSFGYCRDGVGGLCKVKTARWLLPLELADGAPQSAVRLTADARD